MLGQSYGRGSVEDVGQLAADLYLDLEALEAILPASQPADPALSTGRSTVCIATRFAQPVALLAKPRRKEWRHALVTACAERGCRLIDECPGCQNPLTLIGDGYAGCLCGAFYGEARAEQVTALEIEVARLIGGRSCQLAGVLLGANEGLQTARAIWFLCANMARVRTGRKVRRPAPRRSQRRAND